MGIDSYHFQLHRTVGLILGTKKAKRPQSDTTNLSVERLAIVPPAKKNVQDPKLPQLPPLLDMGSLKSLTKEEGNHSIHHHEVIVF